MAKGFCPIVQKAKVATIPLWPTLEEFAKIKGVSMEKAKHGYESLRILVHNGLAEIIDYDYENQTIQVVVSEDWDYLDDDQLLEVPPANTRLSFEPRKTKAKKKRKSNV